jgi:DNA-binding transcriptional ArsR family regulator
VNHIRLFANDGNKVLKELGGLFGVSRVSLLLNLALCFAVANTILLVVHMALPSAMAVAPASEGNTNPSGVYTVWGSIVGIQNSSPSILRVLIDNSPFLSVTSWILVGAVCVWRGKIRLHWERAGLDSSIFELFTRMKGAKTRVALLDALSTPKYRLELARELEMNWRTIDYQVVLLNRHGLVNVDLVCGRIKVYRRTEMGETLLQLVTELRTGGTSLNTSF